MQGAQIKKRSTAESRPKLHSEKGVSVFQKHHEAQKQQKPKNTETRIPLKTKISKIIKNLLNGIPCIGDLMCLHMPLPLFKLGCAHTCLAIGYATG